MIKSCNLFWLPVSLRSSLLTVLLILSGCASLATPYEAPDVKLVSVKLLPSDSLEQRLAIALRVTNPNTVSLKLVGMKYSLRLDGYDLISGVSNDIPTIERYSDTSVELVATVDWLNGLRLLNSLLARPDASVRYELDAKLDPGLLLPAFHVTERGMIDLAQIQ